MYSRIIHYPSAKSFFLFGPRGTGKSTWVKANFHGLYIDLLQSQMYLSLFSSPQRLEDLIPPDFNDWVVIDEIQRVPELLNEVHRLIEEKKLRFVLTGSSARKLRAKGINLLAGRAVTRFMHPLTAEELGNDFRLAQSLRYGHLPSVFSESDPADYLKSYVNTYLREEVQQEGLTRNLQGFARFLEAASFSQASVLNISEVAREGAMNRKVVEGYFHILEDLMLAYRVPVFSKRASRRMAAHSKFFFFDAGIYRAIRPSGPLDRPEEIDGAALETLVLQEIMANISNHQLAYDLYYWRTAHGKEVDFVLYGEKGLMAIEVKRASRIRNKDMTGLRAFLKDYPMARGYLFYGGKERLYDKKIEMIPVEDAIKDFSSILSSLSFP